MEKPHVTAVLYPVQGHLVPLMDLSLYLVKNGVKVTFVNTKENHDRIKNSLSSVNDVLSSEICLLLISDGLEFIESVLNVMPKKVEKFIECIRVLPNQSIGLALEMAEKKGIPCAAFCPASAAQLDLGLSIQKLIDDGIIDKDELCFGLERSNRPFLWVAHMDITEPTENIYPKGFEARVRGGDRSRMTLNDTHDSSLMKHQGYNAIYASFTNVSK
ncbi:UDP-glycosyltransferase 83A1 [Lathyrus oleraceus]|uniref:UDP-glycosyltransferase 83A1 n=1 Tax=Pisum sativum TaxID=3888 RepID=UPI0021CF6ECB|nr:UDP-glycosyltransferase 83A1-like [Pisum sativum]